MNETMKVIVGLLEQGKPELQVAAAQVLGELKPKEAAAIEALSDGIGRSPVLGRFCLDALAKIGSAAALTCIAEAVVDHEVLSDHAAHLLGEVGTPAHTVLARIYPQAIGEQRSRILAVLARDVNERSAAVFVEALLTPDLAEMAAEQLEAAGELAGDSVELLRSGLQGRLDATVPAGTAARVLELLARLDAAGSKAIFLKQIEPDTPPQVRAAAFRALRGVKLTEKQAKEMMAVLEDPTQKDVHEAVREVLTSLPELPSGFAPALKKMLAARNVEQRLFAVRMLRTSGGAELAKSFLKLLSHDNQQLADAAKEGLSQNKLALEPVLKLMQTTKDASLSDTCAQILDRLAEHMTAKVQQATAEKALKQLASNARLGDQLLDLVLHAGGEKLATFLIDKAVRLRRAHKEAEALHVLAKVASSGHCEDEAHYQIALAKLLLSADKAEGEGGPGNSTMGFFAVLIRGGFPLFDRLKRESAVKPEMLLRLATHFANGVGPERRVGTEMLQHLANRTKGRAGDEARLALRAVGI
ncbi:MAG: hypothetical protein AB8H80_20370 [Planctomycetota bacterium]